MSTITQAQYDSSNGSLYRLVLVPSNTALYNMCHLRKGEQLSENQNFSSFRVSGEIPVSGIAYINTEPSEKDIKHISLPYEPHYVTEDYLEYLEKMINLDPINLAWIEKIISGEAESSKVLERNDEYLVVRDWKFDVDYDDNGCLMYKRDDLHLLGIPIERIASIRDIRQVHIPMLEEMKEKALTLCENTFGLKRDEIKMYFHYPPSTFHLHVHFTWAGLDDSTTNFERAFDYDMVIRNIGLDPLYYQKTMKYVKYNR